MDNCPARSACSKEKRQAGATMTLTLNQKLFRARDTATAGRVLCIAWVLLGGPLAAADGGAPRVSSDATEGSGPAEIGRARPALELDALDGTLVNGARVAGRLLIVDFFATWCQPCHRALVDLTAARRASGTASQLVVVDIGETPEVVRRWLATAGIPGDVIVALDPKGVAASRWGANRLPTTFIVDGSGVVRHINRGWGPGYRGRLSRWLRNIAGPPPSPANTPQPPAPPPSSLR
jgi:cytochrome c biogenesis protein CcmG, thiol:disulfide interchange protein DsbE